MAISKTLRYEVLKRDNFACRYCGAAAPDAKLTVDHVIPVALGGSDEPSNLVAACSACNAGKSASSPDAPFVAQVAEDALRWRRAMETANQMAYKEAEVRESFLQEFHDAWMDWYWEVPDYEAGPGKKKRVHEDLPGNWSNSVASLMVAGLSLPDMKEAVDLALGARRIKDRFSYFCGVARNKIAARQAVARELIDRGLV